MAPQKHSPVYVAAMVALYLRFDKTFYAYACALDRNNARLNVSLVAQRVSHNECRAMSGFALRLHGPRHRRLGSAAQCARGTGILAPEASQWSSCAMTPT